MKTVEQLHFGGKTAVVRVDFNVPLDNDYNITDPSRIQAAAQTIQKILNDGGKVVLISHFGRPKEGPEEKYSLKHIISGVSEILNKEVHFIGDCVGTEVEKRIASLDFGSVILCENLRFYSEETKGDIDFAQKLARLGNVYVNDAFGAAHRAHASTAIMAQYFEEKCFGYLMAAEVKNANKILTSPQRPFTAIVGGAKVSDKILIIKNLLNVVDHIIIGGGMAYTFKKALGGTIGNSLFEEDRIESCLEIIEMAQKSNVEIHLPIDSVIADAFSADASTQVVSSDAIPEGWMGLDIGPKAIETYGKIIHQSKTILWNGPMGVFEMKPFEAGTRKTAENIVAATKAGAFSLIGGGDSSAAIKKFNFTEDVSFVSTGGGALLELFEGKVLPGIEAIER